MSKIYISGHKNPDLDSVCSAYAYAVLRNILDPENEYIAVRCGHLGDTAKQIFSNFNVTPPPYMADVYPKVGDVMLSSDVILEKDMPLSEFSSHYQASNPSAIPVFDNGEYYGLLTVDDIAVWAMNNLVNHDNPEPLIGDIISKKGEPVQLTERFDEVKHILLGTKNKTRGVPVFDGDKYVGFVTRRCFLEAPKYNVIMVDHNEPEQSIRGIKTANVVAIVDHHRLDTVKTDLPIYIDAEPLGSTCSIVYLQFIRNGIRPDPITAKVLLIGVVADTLILKSPTTTREDETVARNLAAICGVSVEDFGREMFSNMMRLKDRDPEQAILSDFKKYSEHGVLFGIGQCEVTSIHDIDSCKEDYLNALEQVKHSEGLDWAVVMITDVIKEHSLLLTTSFRAVKHMSFIPLDEHTLDMPDVMSRKKQLLPDVLHALSI